MAYDRDEFVRLLTDYYEFCNRVFWDATVVQAPPGGWPSINQETLASLKRNDTAIDLLRHIPYVDCEEKSPVYVPLVMDNTHVTDYRREDMRKKMHEVNGKDLVPPYDTMPPSCAGIAICWNRNGYYVIVNTDDGYIYWGNPDGRHDEPEPELNRILGDPSYDGPDSWKAGYNVYTPADFFATCKQRFRDLNWIGFGQWGFSCMRMDMNWEYESEPDSDSDEGDDFSHNKQARMMKRADWPGDGEGRDWDRPKFERLMGGEDTEEDKEE